MRDVLQLENSPPPFLGRSSHTVREPVASHVSPSERHGRRFREVWSGSEWWLTPTSRSLKSRRGRQTHHSHTIVPLCRDCPSRRHSPSPMFPRCPPRHLFLALPELTFQAMSVATRCFRTPVVPLDQPQSRYSRGRSCKHYQRHSSAHFARSVPRVAD